MVKCTRFHDHIDPEYQRWGRKYPRFPGVGECVRLINAKKARGAWADIIANELAANASSCLSDLMDAFQNNADGDVRLYVMMALEMAAVPDAVPLLTDVFREGNERLAPYAERALRKINTP
jgi:hypothetical protein